MEEKKKQYGVILKSVANSLLGDDGVRFAPLKFAPQPGRMLRDVIDKDGKVFKPNPYNIPRDPQRVLAFAAHLILGMMDCDRLKYGPGQHFVTKEEWMDYRRLTYELLAGMDAMRSVNKEPMIEYQEQGR